jgi:transcriptional regulator with XRE-family HTH domain
MAFRKLQNIIYGGFAMPSVKGRRAVEKLGEDLRMARLRRGMSMADLAERTGSSERTLMRLEKGDPGVRIGLVAEIMAVLGSLDRMENLMDWRHDDIGQALAQEKLPKRARSSPKAPRRTQSEGKSRSGPTDPDGVGF